MTSWRREKIVTDTRRHDEGDDLCFPFCLFTSRRHPLEDQITPTDHGKLPRDSDDKLKRSTFIKGESELSRETWHLLHPPSRRIVAKYTIIQPT
jgi:hypothetical protein